MRRICASLVGGLEIRPPAEPDQVMGALCRRLEEMTGREVRHTLAAFPPHTVSGLWVATGSADHILCERNTSPWHQLLITCHEFWHIVEGHRLGSAGTPTLTGRELTLLDDTALGRILATRGSFDDAAEREADLFASLLIARLTRRRSRPDRPGTDATPPDAAMHRVERTLRGQPDGTFP
ncbi:hypothetical protein GCM10022245_07780 [Streptomyces mayteni]